MRKSILVIGVLVIFLYVIPNAYSADTYYEIWRSVSNNPDTAIRLQDWWESTSYDDYTGTPGQHYYYWIRVVTAETKEGYDYSPNTGVSMFLQIKCPVAAETGTESPIRVRIAMSTLFPPYAVGDLTCRIREKDLVIDNTMEEWTEYDVYVNPGSDIYDVTYDETWTEDVVISDYEIISPAQVYLWSGYLHQWATEVSNLTQQTDHISVTLRDYSDDAPSNISASQGTYTDRVHITWSPASGNSQLIAAATGWTAIPDTEPPSPNPMTWATAPYETSTYSISMVATTASDPTTPVYYYFEETSGNTGGDNSGWQTDTSYSDSGLSTNYQYGYRVKAKDGSDNETSYSGVSYDYTDIETPSGVTFGTITSTSIQVKSTNTPSGLDRGSSGLYISASTGQSSGWKKNNDYWTCSGLTPNYDTGFKIKARNGDGDQTNYCTTVYKYTLANKPGVSSFSNVTTDTIRVNWTSNGNYYYTEYYCENLTTSQNSGWVLNTYSWTNTGLSSATNYSFRVKARNSEGVETAWTDLGSQMTNYEPVISAITPDTGPTGTYMKIEGQYFYDSGSVIFNGGAMGAIVGAGWNDTVIYCKVPTGAASGSMVVHCPNADSNPINFTITDPNIIYVDDDHTPNIENGTLIYPFSTIQRGIDAATTSDTIVVHQGTFYENTNLNGKNITVTSLDPNDPNIVETTIIDGSQNGPVVTFDSGEDANCVLTGFTITNGIGMALSGGGIYLFQSNPKISHCIIIHNTVELGGGGGGIHCEDSNSIIENCILTENAATVGGGIYCKDSNLIIENCILTENSGGHAPVNAGGGIYCEASNSIIENCILTENAATVGGGIYCYLGNVLITDCNISGNSALWGGGIICGVANILLYNCSITHNTSDNSGGGFYVYDNNDSVISDCTISENDAQDYGGGIYCENSEPNITDTIITNCFASFGAGICSVSSSPKVLNNEIFDNVATYGGGGIFCYGGMPYISNNWITYNYHSGIYSYESAPTLSSNIIAGNEGFLSGGIACDANSAVIIKNNTIVENWGQDSGGIGLDAGSTATVTNSIIWDNFTDSNENQISMFYDEYFAKQTVLDINLSDVEHGFENVYLQDSNCILTWGIGNISTDPCFVETGLWDSNDIWWEGDYHLLPDSPCIDTGDPNYPEDANEFDIDGDSRIIGGRIDIGADEYSYSELSDFNNDGIVDFKDFAILTYYWANYVCSGPDWCEGCDFDESGTVDSNDFRKFTENWLK